MALGVKQQRFVLEFLKDGNGTQAAIRAGYSPHTAAQMATKLLKHPKVGAAIAAELKAQKDRVRVELDELLVELLAIAKSDLGQAFDEHGALKPFDQMPIALRRAIAGVETQSMQIGEAEVGKLVKVKLWDKTKALEQLMRHLGAFKDKLQHEAGPGFAELVKAAMQPKGAA